MSETGKRKEYAAMSDHELLVKLAEQGRHRQMLLRFITVIVLITSAVVLYTVFTVMPKITATAAMINDMNPQITDAVSKVTKMAEDCSASVQKIDKIDIEQLNSAIRDFSKVASTIASLFGK